MMKNSFSFDRFWNLAKLYDASTRRTSIVILLCLTGAILLPYIVNLLPYLYGGRFDAESCAKSSFFLITLLWIIGISSSFKPYFSRSGASAALMLPATNCEKFCYIFIRTLIINVIMLTTISFTIYLCWSLATSQGIDMSMWVDFSMMDWAKTLLLIGFTHSFYLLGASFFRRNSFILTSLVGLALVLIITFIIGMVVMQYVGPTGVHEPVNLNLSDNPLWNLPFVVLTILMWWLSWHRFTKIQITK